MSLVGFKPQKQKKIKKNPLNKESMDQKEDLTANTTL
jgi:hypothetical protein